MQWPVVELAEWEELRQCPDCGRAWLAGLARGGRGGMILCRPAAATARRLRDIDRAATLRAYCLARLEEHFGRAARAKDRLPQGRLRRRKRINGTNYCIEHLIAERFGRHLAKLDRVTLERPARQPRKEKAPEPFELGGFLRIIPGGDLLSHRVSRAVPSALEGLTSEFGMGSGVAPPVLTAGNLVDRRIELTECGSNAALSRPMQCSRLES